MKTTVVIALAMALSPLSPAFAQDAKQPTLGEALKASGSTKIGIGTSGPSRGQGVGGLGSTGKLKTFEAMPVVGPVEPSSDSLDPAIAAALAAAEGMVTSDPEKARATAMALLVSQDPFTVAQRPLFAERLAALLKQLAGNVEGRDGLVLSDAAWIASGRSDDPAHAQRLMQASVQAKSDGNKAESLWLVRRALVAHPEYTDAVKLEHRLSNNPNRALGWGLFWGGLGSLTASAVFMGIRGGAYKELTTVVHTRDEADQLFAKQKLFANLSLVALGVGIGSLFGSLGVMSAGNRTYRPVSPDDLPAAQEWK